VASKADAQRQHIRRCLAANVSQADATASLRERVIGTPSPEFTALLARPSRAAAVLLGLIERPEGPGVLLTERARHLVDHPGQVSLPGGRMHPGENPAETALREADEEVALAPSQVRLLGQLAPQLTGTGFLVTPVVGWIDPAFEGRPDRSEVETIFEVPLAHLAAPENRRQGERVRWNTRFTTDEFYFDRFLIWGATAAILSQFLEIIRVDTE